MRTPDYSTKQRPSSGPWGTRCYLALSVLAFSQAVLHSLVMQTATSLTATIGLITALIKLFMEWRHVKSFCRARHRKRTMGAD